jgi:hypothetical protein
MIVIIPILIIITIIKLIIIITIITAADRLCGDGMRGDHGMHWSVPFQCQMPALLRCGNQKDRRVSSIQGHHRQHHQHRQGLQ